MDSKSQVKKAKIASSSKSAMDWIDDLDTAMTVDEQQLCEAIQERASYFKALLDSDVLDILETNAGVVMILPVSTWFYPRARWSKSRSMFVIHFIQRTELLQRLCEVCNLRELLPKPLQIDASQSSQVSGSSSSSDGILGQFGIKGRWPLVTSLGKSGVSTTALEIALRMKRQGTIVLFLSPSVGNPYLGLVVSMALAFNGNDYITSLCKQCFDANGCVTKDLNELKTLYWKAGEHGKSILGCRCVCIVDNGEMLFDAKNPIGQLLDVLHADGWGRYFEGIIFGKKTLDTETNAKLWLENISMEHRLSMVCVKTFVKEAKCSLNHEQCLSLAEATGYVVGDLIDFLRKYIANTTFSFESFLTMYQEEKLTYLYTMIPLALAKVPAELHGNIKNSVLMMRAGLEVHNAHIPCTPLYDFMFAEKTNVGRGCVFKPMSHVVGIALWVVVIRKEGSGIGYIEDICRQVFQFPKVFGGSVVGKMVELMIASAIEHYGIFKASGSSMFARKKFSFAFKNVWTHHFSGNQVPDPISGKEDVVFYSAMSLTYPDIEGLLHDINQNKGIALQVTLTSPLGGHSNGFYGAPTDDSNEPSHACQWVQKLGIMKDDLCLLWIGRDNKGTNGWQSCSGAWGVPPKHYFTSLQQLIADNAPHLDVLKMIL